MLTKVYGSAVVGVEAATITVEVNTDKGIGYHLVGLPDNAIRESNFRIAAALQNNTPHPAKAPFRAHPSTVPSRRTHLTATTMAPPAPNCSAPGARTGHGYSEPGRRIIEQARWMEGLHLGDHGFPPIYVYICLLNYIFPYK